MHSIIHNHATLKRAMGTPSVVAVDIDALLDGERGKRVALSRFKLEPCIITEAKTFGAREMRRLPNDGGGLAL